MGNTFFARNAPNVTVFSLKANFKGLNAQMNLSLLALRTGFFHWLTRGNQAPCRALEAEKKQSNPSFLLTFQKSEPNYSAARGPFRS
jgi:hypothetical protein